MSKSSRFRSLDRLPKGISLNSGMHPETESLIKHIQSTRKKVLEYKAKSSIEAKRRADSLRRAKARGITRFKRVGRVGSTVYVQVR